MATPKLPRPLGYRPRQQKELTFMSNLIVRNATPMAASFAASKLQRWLWKPFAVWFVGLATATGWVAPTVAGTLDDLSASVVFLKDKVPIVESVNGEAFEVWLKHPRSNIVLQKTLEVSGSGFFVGTERLVYLVTAKHVATNMGRNAEVSLRGGDGKPATLRLGQFMGDGSAQLTWIHHAQLDLSIHPVVLVGGEVQGALRGHVLPVCALKTNGLVPSRDLVLTTLGFPLGLGVQMEFAPIAKESKPASGFLAEGEYGFFLMQDPSISGFSGAPVFEPGDPRVVATSTNGVGIAFGGTGCWGVVSATLGDVSGGKMARIIPSRYVANMIDEFEKVVSLVQATAVGVRNPSLAGVPPNLDSSNSAPRP